MASSPITSWQIEGEEVEIVTDFLFLDSKITADIDCSLEITRLLLLGRKAMANLDSVLKGRGITLTTKVHIVKAMVFCGHVQMRELDHKEGRYQKIEAFELWYWKRCLRVPWISRSNQSILKEINTKYSSEGLMLKLKFQYFSPLIRRADSLEKTLMLGKTEGRRRRGQQRMR